MTFLMRCKIKLMVSFGFVPLSLTIKGVNFTVRFFGAKANQSGGKSVFELRKKHGSLMNQLLIR